MEVHKHRRLLVLVAIVIVVVATFGWWTQRRTSTFFEERSGFRELSSLLAMMISEEPNGVQRVGDHTFIKSFESFFHYVKAKKPEAVSALDAGNPFPGIFPAGRYLRSDQELNSPSDLLFWSDRSHDRGAKVIFRLCADGTILEDAEKKQGYKVAAPDAP